MNSSIHPCALEGKCSDTCAELPLIFEAIAATMKPVISRHGNVIRQEIRSFLHGRMPQFFSFFTFSSRYQIKASEGMVYVNKRASSVTLEKPASPLMDKPIDPEKNNTTYNIRASKYIPIMLFLYYN